MIPVPSQTLVLIALAVVAFVAYLLLARRVQRCPHCGAFVRRARRGWIRCRHCGRQYHRSVRLR